MERFLKLALIVLIPVILWFTTPPEGLTDTAWRLLGFYIAGIVGLILKPYPILCICIILRQCKRYLGRLRLHSIVDDYCCVLLERCIW